MIKVLLADDHAIVRGGSKEILLRHLESAECGEAENAEQVLALVRKHPWDLLILDITMPGRSGQCGGSAARFGGLRRPNSPDAD
jgi:two-component system, NarL family, invasion response regulator UvrY